MRRRVLFVLATTLALCVSGYTQAGRNSPDAASGRGSAQARVGPTTPRADDWLKILQKGGVPCGKACGVSGVALIEATPDGRIRLLVVHDADASAGVNAARLGIVTIDPKNTGRVNYEAINEPLKWPGGKPPNDLEAVTSVPGQRDLFLAMTSEGWVLPLTVRGTTVTPGPGFKLREVRGYRAMEGLSVQRLEGRLVIAWGYRGAGTDKGILYYGLLDLEKEKDEEKVIVSGRTPIGVSYLSVLDGNTRHIADLKIDEQGYVWASTTHDPGDSGPFESAVYKLGKLDASQKAVRLNQDGSPSLVQTFKRKVEGVELLPGGVFVFGAEDENDGGWLLKWPQKVGRVESPKK